MHVSRSGHERVHPYTSEKPLVPGDVVHYEGRDWLVEELDGMRVSLKPARYRLRLRHPDGRQELGAFRRYRDDAPTVGHTFSTLDDGAPISWQVVDSRLAEDDQGEPYLDLTAERDYSEADEAPTLPEHELEHALERQDDDRSAAEAARPRAGGRALRRAGRARARRGARLGRGGALPRRDRPGGDSRRPARPLRGRSRPRSARALALDGQGAAGRRPGGLPRRRRGQPRRDRGVGLPGRPGLRGRRQLRERGRPEQRSRLAHAAV